MQSEFIIEPTKGFSALRLREVWNYRELLYFLVWRDVKIKYKQTFLGVAWALFRPLMAMAVFTFVFNKLAGFSVEGVPYVLFTLCGIVAWSFFSEGVGGASQSLLNNSNLITKVYFPRVLVPASAVLSGMIDFCISLALLLAALVWYSVLPSMTLFLLPLFFLLVVMTSLGLGLWFSSLSVQYRDVAHALPFIIQLLFWISPVGYSSTRVPESLQFVYWLNPLTCAIEGFRYAILGTGELALQYVLVSVGSSCVILITGALHFLRTERKFADVI